MRVLLARYYDPQTGQFLDVGPMVQETLEAFEYAGDDPVNGDDPDGLFAASECEAPGNAESAQCRNQRADLRTLTFIVNALGVAAVTCLTDGAGDVVLDLGDASAESATALPAFSDSTIDQAEEEVAEPYNDRTSVGARALSKKLGQGAPAFKGVEPTTQNAEAIVRDILEHPVRTVFGSDTYVFGSDTYDVYNAAAQGARFEMRTNAFVGFLDASIATR